MENKLHKNYLSVSAYKGLQECSAKQVAKDLGLFVEPPTKPMLIGSYVDAYFSGTLADFKNNNPQIFKKDGNLYADFEMAEDIIAFIKKDALLMKYLTGDKMQFEVKGTIAGVEWLGYIDSLHTGKAIVDLKVVADLYTKVWSTTENMYVHFIESYGYDKQAAIYQELYFQMTGERLPVFLAMVTKQQPYFDKAIVQIPQGRMDYLIDEMSEKAPALLSMRNGSEPVKRCEKCEYCRSTKMLKETITVFDLM